MRPASAATLLRGLGRAASSLRTASPLSEANAAASLLVTRIAQAYAEDSAAASLKKTPLYNFHLERGGKMVPWGGWTMPYHYQDSIMEAASHCRTSASLFDVSHACSFTLKGRDAIPFLERLVVSDIAGLANGSSCLSMFTNERGGIIDDTVVTRVADDELFLVVNAGCRDKDLAHLGRQLAGYKGDVRMTVHDDRALLALQGPQAARALQRYMEQDLDNVYFNQFLKADIRGIPCLMTRTGYTGEDGFEISVPSDMAVGLAAALLGDERVRLCGMAARYSLRLEAGLCRYGSDLTEDVTPIEAGLGWTVGKRRRERFDFLGGEVIRRQLAEGVSIRRMGLVTDGSDPAHEHSEVLTPEGQRVGKITSGAFSPCLQRNIAMGYVDKTFAKAGTPLSVVVHGRPQEATVAKMPFLLTRYHKAPQVTLPVRELIAA
ncbi:hypothetical protein N2152v2_002313 [Parachlorella kessleri]